MATNRSIEIIKSIIEYVESNIREKIDLDSIERNLNMSKNHLHRLFKAVTNKKLIDYVRNRKLSCSIYDLLYTKLNIIDIAYEYGFEYEQSYIRSFSKAFKISPKRFRKGKNLLKIEDKFDISNLYPIGQSGILLYPVIMIKPGFSVIGMDHIILFKDNIRDHKVNKVGLEFWDVHRHKIKNITMPDIYMGIAQYKVGVLDRKRYIPCVEVSDLRNVPSGMIGLSIPTYKYAVFKFICLHNVRELSIEDVKHIQCRLNEWLLTSNYKLAEYFQIESIYFKISNDQFCEVECYLPIKDKETPSEGNQLLIPIQEL